MLSADSERSLRYRFQSNFNSQKKHFIFISLASKNHFADIAF